jgi:hypothetical protein
LSWSVDQERGAAALLVGLVRPGLTDIVEVTLNRHKLAPIPPVPEPSVIVNIKRQQPFAIGICVDANRDISPKLSPVVRLGIASKDQNREPWKGLVECVTQTSGRNETAWRE